MRLSGIITGLGNPGKEYEKTRHNFGFMLVDRLLEASAGQSGHGFNKPEKLSSSKDKYELWKAWLMPPPAAPTLLLKPLTYMNNSGQAVSAVMRYYHLEPSELLVIHDELDIPLGEMRFKLGGGSAGHKGVNSIAEHLGTVEFYRLRLGIGKSRPGQTNGHVLGNFGKEENEITQGVLEAASNGILLFQEQGFTTARNHFNGYGRQKRSDSGTDASQS